MKDSRRREAENLISGNVEKNCKVNDHSVNRWSYRNDIRKNGKVFFNSWHLIKQLKVPVAFECYRRKGKP